jgi:hypothetical protein
LTQHNIRIVPAEKVKGKRGILNVPSGTCLDHTVTSFLDGQNRAAVWPDISSPMDSPQPQIFSNRDADGFDFLLTAHGGLKGTSKPIFYRVVSSASLQSRDNSSVTMMLASTEMNNPTEKQIFNENFVWRPWSNGSECTPLTKETIQDMTYAMSFQYGTASKAVRMVPVVKYAFKLGNTAAGWLSCKKCGKR